MTEGGRERREIPRFARNDGGVLIVRDVTPISGHIPPPQTRGWRREAAATGRIAQASRPQARQGLGSGGAAGLEGGGEASEEDAGTCIGGKDLKLVHLMVTRMGTSRFFILYTPSARA